MGSRALPGTGFLSLDPGSKPKLIHSLGVRQSNSSLSNTWKKAGDACRGRLTLSRAPGGWAFQRMEGRGLLPKCRSCRLGARGLSASSSAHRGLWGQALTAWLPVQPSCPEAQAEGRQDSEWDMGPHSTAQGKRWPGSSWALHPDWGTMSRGHPQ